MLDLEDRDLKLLSSFEMGAQADMLDEQDFRNQKSRSLGLDLQDERVSPIIVSLLPVRTARSFFRLWNHLGGSLAMANSDM